MFNSLLRKTLYQKRWMMIGWFVSLISLTLFTMIFYPTFRNSGMFDEALMNVPDSLKAFIGDTSAFTTFVGYVHQQMFVQTAPIFLIILAVIYFSGAIAGEEGEGLLGSLLSRPLSRATVYIHKLTAGAVISLVVSMGIFAGVVLSLPLINESIPFARLLLACIDVWAITMVFGLMAYMLGAISGRRGFAGGVTGGIAFLCFIISNLAPGVSALKPVDKLLPFHYYNNPSILRSGFSAGDFMVLMLVAAAFAFIGWWQFNRRDIFQR